MSFNVTPSLVIDSVGKSANPNAVIVERYVDGIRKHGAAYGLDRAQRFVHFHCQVAHECDSFRTLTEYGGSRARYAPYYGRGLIQTTWKDNYASFRDWCTKQGYNPPDFVKNPDAILAWPWAFLSAVYYFSRHDLWTHADGNELLTISRKINQGPGYKGTKLPNGWAHRKQLFVRTSLVVLGYELRKGVIAEFQKSNGLLVDDIPGQETRNAMFRRLGDAGTGRVKPRPKAIVPKKEKLTWWEWILAMFR